MRKKLNLILIVIVLLLSTTNMISQDISRPLFAIGNATTDQICVTPASPNREALAVANRNFLANTEFILELSDEEGVFPIDNIRVLTRFVSPLELAPTEQIVFPSFPIPTDLRSDDYRIRVRYIEPNANTNIGAARVVAIHFFDNTERVTLIGPNPNTNVVALCSGESTTLNVIPENLGEYQWFFNGNPIAEATGTSLENVFQPGTYTVLSDFGSCNDRFIDNESTVTVVNFNKTTVTINGPTIQEYCPNDIKVLTCSIAANGLIYEWFKDDELIEGETDSSIILPESNFSGFYTVRVTGTNTCFEITNPVEVINLGSDILTRPPPEIILLPSQGFIVLDITTNAPLTSTIEWFRNDVSQDPPAPISDAGALSFTVTNPAEYRAEFITTDVCNETIQIITNVFSANSINAEIASIINCDDNASSTIALENLFGVIDNGAQVPLTPDQYAFFNFEWFRNGTATGITETFVDVSDSDVGQTYVLQASIQDVTFPTTSSNELVVEFLDDIVQIEVDPAVLPEGGTVTLTAAPLSTNYSYEWFLNNEIIPGELGNTIEVDTEGQYFVRISLSDCFIDSETVSVSSIAPPGETEIIPNVVTPNNDGINDNWLLPESLFNQQDVEVTIYDTSGRVDFMGASYQNNWPLQNSKSLGQNPIYYYIITKNNSVVRKGSITVMR